MREFLSQQMRGATLDETGYVGWQGIGVGTNEHMDVIGLNSQLNNFPSVFMSNFMNNLFQAFCYLPLQNLASPLGTPDNVVHDEVDGMLFVRLIHVDSIA